MNQRQDKNKEEQEKKSQPQDNSEQKTGKNKEDKKKQSDDKGKLPLPLKPEGNHLKTLAIWLLIIFSGFYIAKVLVPGVENDVVISYSEFRRQVETGNVHSIKITGQEVLGILKEQQVKYIDNETSRNYTRFIVHLIPLEDPKLMDLLIEKGVIIESKEKGFSLFNLLVMWGPWIIFIGLWFFIMRQMQGGSKGIFSFGKSKARQLTPDKVKITFENVAGADEAKQELQEIIEFLRAPDKFTKLGGKIPKGALLLGPPGTGKTLLAKAVAGEAKVPFFSMSGSDFVEMFVGVGASRVRDMFNVGKKNAPCIIFVDEIDAVGRQRGTGLGGGHDEREQTLNQLLVEMDGFDSKEGVILIAATNRPDVLDSALLRPGRFDRQIVVDLPDVKGREGILRVHTREIKLHSNVNLPLIAKGSPGMSGADLANLVNEAALLAARKNRKSVVMNDFEEAKDKVMMGAERRSLTISQEEKKIISYHESGHVLAAKNLEGSDPVHKVTIIPRGRALGVTHSLPEDDRHLYSRKWAINKICQLLGGRIAEHLVFDEISSGASNDIEVATKIARMMVCDWGMSKKIGPLSLGKKGEQIFIGREITKHQDFSESTAVMIDSEIKLIIDECYAKTEKILKDNFQQLKMLSEALLKKEILTSEEIDKILNTQKSSPIKKKNTPAKNNTKKTVPDKAAKKTPQTSKNSTAKKKVSTSASKKKTDSKSAENKNQTKKTTKKVKKSPDKKIDSGKNQPST